MSTPTINKILDSYLVQFPEHNNKDCRELMEAGMLMLLFYLNTEGHLVDTAKIAEDFNL